MDKVHFSTGKDDWGTPQDLFDALKFIGDKPERSMKDERNQEPRIQIDI